MMRKLLTALLVFSAVAAAESSLVDLIMPDARVVLGVNMARIRSSPLSAAFSGGVQNANPEMQKLMEAAGFDPLRDLQEILFASPGTGKNPPALVVARGTFDTAKLRAFAETAGSKVTEWQGVPILTDPEKDSGAFALLDNMILAGNLDQIKAAIGRRGRGMVLNTEMALRIADLGRRYDAWLVSIAPLATLAANLPEDAKGGFGGADNLAMLRTIDQFSLGVSLSADVTLGAEIVASDGKAAGALADAIQMLMAMAQKNIKDQPAAIAALRNLNFGVDENVVHLAFTVPVAEVEKAVQNALAIEAKRPGQVAAARQAGPEMPAVQQAAAVVPVVTEPVVTQSAIGQPAATASAAPTVVTGAVAKSPKIPGNAQLLIQSSPKDMGTVLIMGSKK